MKALALAAVLVGFGLTAPAQAAETAVTAQAPIKATATAALDFERVNVGTVAAPKPVKAAVAAPVAVAAVPAPIAAVAAVPATEAVPTTEDNGQVVNNGNPDCQVPGSIQYSDGSCTFQTVGDEISFAEPGNGVTNVPAEIPAQDSTGATAPACGELELGEAWAGHGTHCGLDKDPNKPAGDEPYSWFPEDEPVVNVCGVPEGEEVLGSC